MTFSPDLAAIRFGCGLSPAVPAAGSPEAMLRRLGGPDLAAREFPIPDFQEFAGTLRRYRDLRKQRNKAKGTALFEQRNQDYSKFLKESRFARARWAGQSVLRWSRTGDGFRERLALFWADHFTAQGKAGVMKLAAAPYVESAIRPHVAGRFEDLLISAVTHPLMLHYLDQNRSAGPGSRAAARSKRLGGLNENLAREVLELHTLGVDGPYSQDDVRQLAELFTGLSFSLEEGFVFRPGYAEPGAETVLGRSYGGGEAGLEPVLQALRDLAVHPATAQHIARKLAVHFTSDDPDPHLVAYVANRFQRSGGDLMQVYEALLEHPEAWKPQLANVKPPFDFIASSCRALGVGPDDLAAARPRQLLRNLVFPLAMMGQKWEFPGGPDGWPEEDAAWITPQGLASRMRWAMAAPGRLVKPLPDPEAFAAASLGQNADGRVLFAARAAETRPEAIGLVLSSPAFQRR